MCKIFERVSCTLFFCKWSDKERTLKWMHLPYRLSVWYYQNMPLG